MDRTGLITRKCYAATYADCDGRPATREHWISKGLLNRIQDDGTGLNVTGLAWLDGSRPLRESNLTAKMLCGRHNQMLHELDDAVIALHDAWLRAGEGQRTQVTVNGTHLERWGLKVLVGMIASGSARVDGHKIKVNPPRSILDVVFGLRELLTPRGFYFCVHDDFDDGFKIKVNTPPRGHELEGIALGITVQIVAFRFLVLLEPVTPDTKSFFYRPAGIDFGSVGKMDLTWSSGAQSGHVPLDVQIRRSPRELA